MGAILDVALLLEGVLGSNTADTTSNLEFGQRDIVWMGMEIANHDGLVVTSVFGSIGLGLIGEESPEGSGKGWATKFVIESRGTNWSLKHDVETGGVVGGSANVDLPRLLVTGDQKIRDPETAETSLGRGTSSNSAFVANFASATSGGARERGNSRRVVVRLDLDERLDNLLGQLPATSRVIGSPVMSLDTIEAIINY